MARSPSMLPTTTSSRIATYPNRVCRPACSTSDSPILAAPRQLQLQGHYLSGMWCAKSRGSCKPLVSS